MCVYARHLCHGILSIRGAAPVTLLRGKADMKMNEWMFFSKNVLCYIIPKVNWGICLL